LILSFFDQYRKEDMSGKNFAYRMLILTVVLLFFMTAVLSAGCGRRALIRKALADKESLEMEGSGEEDDSANGQQSGGGQDAAEDPGDQDAVSRDDDSAPEQEVDDAGEQAGEQEDENSEPEPGGEEDPEEDNEPADDQEEEPAEEAPLLEEITAEAPAAISEGGFMTEERALNWSKIYVGDDGDKNVQCKGFASFDISGFSGQTITKAKLSAVCSEVKGTPFRTYGPLVIKAVYYGPRSVDTDIFNIEGVELANFEKKDFTIAGAILKNDLQNALDHAIDRYQVCLYFEMPETADGDGIYDILVYQLEDITLLITYLSEE
jgi:hypothetical protein